MSRSTVIAREKTEGSHARRRVEEAARWFVLLQNAELSPRMLRAWKKWEAVPENRDVFDVVARWWRQPDDEPPPEPSPQERAADEYDGSVPISSWLPTQVPVTTRVLGRRVVIGALAVAAATVAAVVGLHWSGLGGYRAKSNDVGLVSAQTGIREHRELMLADGTRVHLGAQTLVTAKLTEHARSIVLHRGEALFEVAHDRQRPFRVDAGMGNITAVGTAFSVQRRADDQVVVTVTEGIVEVSPRLSAEDVKGTLRGPGTSESELGPVQRLKRGQEITLASDGRLGPIRTAGIDTSTRWRDGRFTYRSEPLRHVVEDLNRYSRRPVIIGDAPAGDLLYSGTVFERHIRDWIGNLEKIYPELEVVTTHDRIVIRTRAAAARLTD